MMKAGVSLDKRRVQKVVPLFGAAELGRDSSGAGAKNTYGAGADADAAIDSLRAAS